MQEKISICWTAITTPRQSAATKKVYVYAAEADEFTNSLIKEVNSGNHRVRAVAQFVEKK